MGYQGKVVFFGDAGWRDWRVRIFVAKSTYSARLPCQNLSWTRVWEGRAKANKQWIPSRVRSTLLCFSIWSMRDSMSLPEDMRCAGRAGCAGAVAMLQEVGETGPVSR